MPAHPITVREAAVAVRVAFLRRTLAHLAVTVAAVPVAIVLVANLARELPLPASLGLLLVGAWLARRWGESEPMAWLQYAGLGFHVLLLALALTPVVRLASDERLLVVATTLVASLALGLMLAAWRMRDGTSPLVTLFYLCGPLLLLSAVLTCVLSHTAPALLALALLAVVVAGLANLERILTFHRADQPAAAALSLAAVVAVPVVRPAVLLVRAACCRD